MWHPWTKVAAKHIRCIWQSCRAALQGSCRNWKYVCSKMNKQMHILTHMLMLMLLNFSPLFVFLLGLGRLPVVFCQVVHRSSKYVFLCGSCRYFSPCAISWKRSHSFFQIYLVCLVKSHSNFSNPLSLFFLLSKGVQEGLRQAMSTVALSTKGQIISEQICGVLKFSKEATIFCQDFCPSL